MPATQTIHFRFKHFKIQGILFHAAFPVRQMLIFLNGRQQPLPLATYNSRSKVVAIAVPKF
jgi:hypothetical protein